MKNKEVTPTKFLGPVGTDEKALIDACDNLLTHPERLVALEKSMLMNTPTEEAFDRLAELAAKVLKVPLTIVSLVSDTKQFFKAGYGLPAPYNEMREIPIDDSICRYTLSKEMIIAADAAENGLLKNHPTVGPWGIVAFIAIPMVDVDGHVLGAFCAVDTAVRPWSDEDINIMKELTRSIMTEIQLRRQIAELKTEKELRDRFVIALSHDLRNPLNVMKMAAEILDDSEISAKERQQLNKMISDNADRADQMIQELLDSNRLSAGHRLNISMEQINFSEILESITEGLQRVHGNRFELKGQDIEVRANCSANSLRRMVENLANNAIKYGSPDHKITIELASTADNVTISVHNHGKPISGDSLKKLFELFQRSDSAILGSQSGWGIGLTVVRGLAEAMNGSVSAESSVENGTVFKISLPR